VVINVYVRALILFDLFKLTVMGVPVPDVPSPSYIFQFQEMDDSQHQKEGNDRDMNTGIRIFPEKIKQV
ncbi:MAG: hypothetical protein ABFD59_00030, partial [Smithella sp.]